MSCTACGGTGNQHTNPLECNANLLSCNNPCNVSSKNSAACESLPSQIENFTLQFFGTVVKTEVNGVVGWSLPCSLDVGLPDNPRGVDEGLACYFLRLFADGIVGLTGPKGDTGAAGTDGANAFTVTLKGFSQPNEGGPVTLVTLVTQFNPAMLENLYVFVVGSGWYVINSTDGSGALFTTLVKSISGVPAGTHIPAGKLVVPSGFPGASIAGPQGPQGSVGPQGPAGSSFTATNNFTYNTIGTDYPLQVAYAEVNFTAGPNPEVLLSAAGTYLVTAVIDLVGTAGVATSDVATLKLFNVSTASDIPTERAASGFIDTQRLQIVLSALVNTGSTNQTIAVYGKCTSANRVSVKALNTTLSYVRIA